MARILFDSTMQGVAEAMTLHQRRHEVLVSNIANVETPGFRARELDFETALRDAFVSEERPAGEPPVARVIEDPDAPMRADGSTVDLDLQMAKLAANGGRYVTLAKLLGNRIALLRQAIEGSR
jgi:flagellar basal-body rod protein FlgB